MKYEEDPTSGEERFFQDIPSKAVFRAICIVVALFGGMFLAGGLDRVLKGAGPDDIFLLVMGIAILAGVWRFWKVTLGPRMVFSSREIVLNKFFRKQKWQISDISSIASFPTIIYPRSAKGRSLSPIPIHYLGIKDRGGRVSKFTLPGFVGNEQLMSSLLERTKLAIEDIKDEEGFDAWKKASA